MPKPYKKREFEYHFSQDDENTTFNFKKDFTILLTKLFPKNGSVRKGDSLIIQFLFVLGIILITLLLLNYFGIINFIWTK